MKKLLFLVLGLLLMFSCKKELPSNIKDAVGDVNYFVSYQQNFDSTIISLDTVTINNMDKDTLYKLYFNSLENEKKYNESISKLDELLKYNPEYSDYDEIKNIKKPYRDNMILNVDIENSLPYAKNINKIFERLLKIDYESATYLFYKYKK